MKCRACRKNKAEINLVMPLCNECFMKIYERRVKRVVKRFKLIEPGDRVLASLSGGKDSMAMLIALAKLRQEIDFELEAFYMDVGLQICTNPRTLSTVQELCKAFNVKLNVVKFDEVLPTKTLLVSRERKRPVCSICGLVKRRLMNIFAREHGFNKIATGHCADDIVRFFFKNWMSGQLAWVAKLKPLVPSTHAKLVAKIRPLYECLELENLHYVKLHGFKPAGCSQCSFFLRNDKWHNLLMEIEKKVPGFKLNFVKRLEELNLNMPNGSLKECKICGEPTNLEICGYCKLFNKGEIGAKGEN